MESSLECDCDAQCRSVSPVTDRNVDSSQTDNSRPVTADINNIPVTSHISPAITTNYHAKHQTSPNIKNHTAISFSARLVRSLMIGAERTRSHQSSLPPRTSLSLDFV